MEDISGQRQSDSDDRGTGKQRSYMSDIALQKFTVQEKNRFVLWDNMMASEVKLGRTVFDVTSRMTNEANNFKDVVKRVAEREIRRADRNTG